MKKSTKIALGLIISGLALFVICFAALGFDMDKLPTERCETNTHTVTDDFDKLNFTLSTADITFAVAEDGVCRVECFEYEKEKHSVSVKDGTLTVKCVNTRKWYDYISVNVAEDKVTVYLPKTEYASLKLKTDTGDVNLSRRFSFNNVTLNGSTCNLNIGAKVSGRLSVTVSTGDVNYSAISGGKVLLRASTGDIRIKGTVCDTFDIKTSTGDIFFDKADAATHVNAKTSTGNIKGSFRTDKIFFVETSTGDINVPRTTSGAPCDFSTSTGDINIKIKK